MSKNTYVGTNVITTDTFSGWVDKTNQIREDMGTIVVTVTTASGTEPNTTNAGLTTGNLAIQGVVTANTIAVSSVLRGGTVTTNTNLTITSNALFTTTGNVEFTAANNINIDANNLILSSNVIFDGGVTKSVRIDTANTTVNTGAFFVNSNSVFSSNVTMTGANTTIGDAGADILNVVASPTFTANATFTSNVLISGANTNLTGTMTVGNLIVTGTTSLASNVSFFVNTATANTSTVFSVFESQGNTILGDTSADRLVVNANTLFSSNVTISGTTNVETLIANSKTIAVGGNITTANSLTTSGNFALTLTQTGATNVTLPTTGTLATTGNLAQFAATTSTQLRSVISDETGSGSLVFGTSPTLTTPTLSDATLDGTTSISGNMTVTGNLTINGTTTTINSTTLTVDDKNIELGSVVTPTDLTANGGGITLKGDTDKTINWLNTTDAWTSSEDFNLLTGNSYKINNVTVLSSTALGTGITDSSLTSVGTLTSGTWSASTIALNKGGTGATTAAGARTALGLSTMAIQSESAVTITGGSITGITDLAIADGGTGSSTAAGALVNLGISASAAELNIMNGITASTVELNYTDGVTSAIQTQLNTKAPLASPTFTGTVTAPTLSVATSLTIGGTAVTDVATQAQAEAGTVNTVLMTPLRTAQAIAASTAEVLEATAGGTFGDVGTYAFLGNPLSGTGGLGITAGSTEPGSALGRAALFDEDGNDYMGMVITNSAMSGTWRLMGGSFSSSRDRNLGIFLRIA